MATVQPPSHRRPSWQPPSQTHLLANPLLPQGYFSSKIPPCLQALGDFPPSGERLAPLYLGLLSPVTTTPLLLYACVQAQVLSCAHMHMCMRTHLLPIFPGQASWSHSIRAVWSSEEIFLRQKCTYCPVADAGIPGPWA